MLPASLGPAFGSAFAAAPVAGTLKVRRITLLFHEVGDVQKGVAFQADIHKCRLHAGQHARYAPVIDGAGERVLVLALVVDLA